MQRSEGKNEQILKQIEGIKIFFEDVTTSGKDKQD